MVGLGERVFQQAARVVNGGAPTRCGRCRCPRSTRSHPSKTPAGTSPAPPTSAPAPGKGALRLARAPPLDESVPHQNPAPPSRNLLDQARQDKPHRLRRGQRTRYTEPRGCFGRLSRSSFRGVQHDALARRSTISTSWRAAAAGRIAGARGPQGPRRPPASGRAASAPPPPGGRRRSPSLEHRSRRPGGDARLDPVTVAQRPGGAGEVGDHPHPLFLDPEGGDFRERGRLDGAHGRGDRSLPAPAGEVHRHPGRTRTASAESTSTTTSSREASPISRIGVPAGMTRSLCSNTRSTRPSTGARSATRRRSSPAPSPREQRRPRDVHLRRRRLDAEARGLGALEGRGFGVPGLLEFLQRAVALAVQLLRPLAVARRLVGVGPGARQISDRLAPQRLGGPQPALGRLALARVERRQVQDGELLPGRPDRRPGARPGRAVRRSAPPPCSGRGRSCALPRRC